MISKHITMRYAYRGLFFSESFQMDLSGVQLENLQITAVYDPPEFPDQNQTNECEVLTNTISNLALYHISDKANKSQESRVWRRKVREIIQSHQEQILQFFVKPIPVDHTLNVATQLLIRYGKMYPMYDPSRHPPKLLRDYIVDISSNGLDSLNEYIDGLMKARVKDTPSARLISISKNLLDYMRDVGEELIRIDDKLKKECLHVDSIVEKVSHLIDLPNPEIDGFEAMMELYIEKQFAKHPIHAVYWDYIYTLQKYSALRDILIPQRIVNTSEPICCICMTEPIVMAMIPCGHTFCTNCSKRTTICHVCRQGVTNRLRLFFS